MHIKIVINSQFIEMNSGWHTRYIGLIKEIYNRNKISIFAPGNTSLFKKNFPKAQICPDTDIGPIKKRKGVIGLANDIFFPNVNSLRYFTSPSNGLKNILINDSTSYDASVYFGMGALICYGRYDKGQNIIVDFCDSLLRNIHNEFKVKKSIYIKISLLYDYMYVKRIKKKFIPQSAKIIAITDEDNKFISKTLPKNKIYTIPNGIHPLEINEKHCLTQQKYNSSCILFLGSLNYEPNELSILHSLEHLWPEIKAKNPQAIFKIVGRDPSYRIRAAAENINGVELVGYVENVYDYYLQAKCFLGPIFTGAGLKNKFLESINAGTPIVTTPEGAIGLNLIHGKHGFIGQKNAELIEGVNTILNDTYSQYSLYVENCFNKAKEHSWETIGQKLCRIFYSS